MPREWKPWLLVFAAMSVSANAWASGAEARPVDAPILAFEPGDYPLPPEYLTEGHTWITFAFHPGARDQVKPLLEQADSLRSELSELFGRGVLTNVEVRIAALPGELMRLVPNTVGGRGPGLSLRDQDLIVLSADASDSRDLMAQFRHELAHLALDHAVQGRAVPAWFHEGFAIHFAEQHNWLRYEIVSNAWFSGTLLRLPELGDMEPKAFQPATLAGIESGEFFRFIRALNANALSTWADQMQRGADFEAALTAASGARLNDLDGRFRGSIGRRYGLFPVLAFSTMLFLAMVGTLVAWKRFRQSRATPQNDENGEDRAPRRVRVPSARRRPHFRPEAHREPGVPKIEHNGNWHTLH